MAFTFRCVCLALVALLASPAYASLTQENPVQQVVNLLRGLVKKVEQDGKQDAESYDKFACFCKDQADEKTYAMDKSSKKIHESQALVEQLESDLSVNNDDIMKLNQKMSELDARMKKEMEERSAAHSKYVEMSTEMESGIDDLKAAVEGLRSARPTDFMQIKNVATRVLNTASKRPSLVSSGQQKDLLQSLSLISDDQKPKAYEFQSNDLIATLQGIKREFMQNKADLDQEEFEANSAYDHRRQSMQQRHDVAKTEKQEKEQQVEKDTDANERAKEILSTEKDHVEKDQRFRVELMKDCEQKARDYDQRSSTRSNELVALNSAVSALQSGEVPSSFLQQDAHTSASTRKALSFLQVREVGPMQRVVEMLSEKSSRYHSTALATLAAKVKLSKDHFVKVRQLVKDLINRLQSDAAYEQNIKSFCDKQMEKATNSKQKAQMNVEQYIAKLRALEARDAKLRGDIADENAAIAADRKALQEAAELRNGEHGDNAEAIETAKGGKEACQYALTVLKEFYEGQGEAPSFVQQPADADRNGQTVSELAPTTQASGYHGDQQGAQNIIGLLEAIMEDFRRQETEVSDAEGNAQDAYNEQTAETEADAKSQEEESSTDTVADKNVRGQIADVTDDEVNAEQQLKEAIKAAGGVKELCADGSETYEEKKAAREKEVEALKEAIVMLDEMA